MVEIWDRNFQKGVVEYKMICYRFDNQEGGEAMRRRLAVVTILWVLLSLLSGCGLRSGDDLYALPKTSVEYESLQQALQELLDGGLEYAPPLSGSNTQPVQDVDLDGDGIGEAVAFFRDTSGKEAGLQVYLFAQNEAGVYEVMTVISGQGSAVNSVTYPKLMGGDNREVVISWQISSGIYALSAYSVWQGGSQELMASQNYTRYVVQDMDQNGVDEILLLHLDPSDVGNNRAECYGYADGGLVKRSEAHLSHDLASIERIRASHLVGGESAVYLTGYVTSADGTENTSNIQITDILAMRNGELVNVTMDESAGSSLSTRRRIYVTDQDLNGDGIWEIPVLSNSYERLEDGTVCVSENFYLISWVQFDLEGNQQPLCTTYYNSSDGWYLMVPEEWKGQIALARSDTNEGNTVERSIQFYALEKVDQAADSQLQVDPVTNSAVLSNTEAKLFMTIYKNTGADRTRRSSLGGRSALDVGEEDASYAVSISGDALSGWTAETVQENLRIIVTNWAND